MRERIRIVLVTAYGATEQFRDMIAGFDGQNVDVCHYPLLQNVTNHIGSVDDVVDHFHNFLLRQNPHAILWQCLILNPAIMQNLKRLHGNRHHLHYSVSDPHAWTAPSGYAEKQRVFDKVFTTCQNAVERYSGRGQYIPVCVSSRTFSPRVDKQFECDVAFVLDTLDHVSCDPTSEQNALIERFVRSAPALQLNLYGPAIYAELFPAIYKCTPQWRQLPSIFSMAKVVIIVGNRKNGAVSDSAIQALASGALLVLESNPDANRVLKVGAHFLELPFEDPASFVQNIVSDQAAYKYIREEGRRFVSQCHRWTNLAFGIIEEIVCQTFDYKYYNLVNLIQPDTFEQAWQHWQRVGRNRGALTFRPVPSDDFDWRECVGASHLEALIYSAWHDPSSLQDAVQQLHVFAEKNTRADVNKILLACIVDDVRNERSMIF